MCTSTAVRLVVNGLSLAANALELAITPNLPTEKKIDLVTKSAMNALAIGSAGSQALGCPSGVQEGFIPHAVKPAHLWAGCKALFITGGGLLFNVCANCF